MALQVNPLQAEAALPPGAIFSRSFPGILGSSDSVQIHHHLDKDLNLPPLPAHLHDQDFSANGAHHHGLCHHVRFREHHSNDCTVHATRAHLGSCCPRELHQSHGFLVCECFSEHHRRLPDTCPAYARCQKLAATSTTAVGSHNGLRLGWLVRLSSSRLTMLTASQRLHHIDLADDHPQYWIQSQRSNIRHTQLDYLDNHRGQHCNHMCLSTHAQEPPRRPLPAPLPSRFC